MTPGFRHVVETQQRIGAILKGRFGVLAVAQLKFHIALADGKPHLADQHVLEFEEIVARGDAERVRTALRLRGKHHAPRRKTVLEILRSVRVGLRDHRPVEIANLRDDFHTCAIGIQRTEHGVGLVALQYHMRGENRRHMQHTG